MRRDAHRDLAPKVGAQIGKQKAQTLCPYGGFDLKDEAARSRCNNPTMCLERRIEPACEVLVEVEDTLGVRENTTQGARFPYGFKRRRRLALMVGTRHYWRLCPSDCNVDIIFLAEDGRQRWQLSLPRLAALASVVALGAAGVFYVGAEFGIDSVRVEPTGAVSLWHQDLALQEAHVSSVIERTENDVNALARRLGRLQARADRLDALGAGLLEQANLSAEELGFAGEPGLGGRAPAQGASIYVITDFLSDLRMLEARLADREPKLEALSDALLNRDLRAGARPSGWPVENGWMSSGYGYRPDPKTGKRVFHRGTDFAGRKGTRIFTTADGVVTESAYMAGYGNVVKVSHADGYVTRYAHNSKNLVSVGDVVRKGTPIALMGATGRTTGTHLHYEVHHNGRALNPKTFVSRPR